MTTGKAVLIGVAVVESAGHYLIGWRTGDQSLAGKAEFPGGKCEPGESPMLAAVRECREETGVEIEPVMLLEEQCFEYDHATVDLRFWLCKPTRDVDLGAEHNGFRWIKLGQLLEEDFPEANRTLLEKLDADGPFFRSCV